MDWKWFHLYSPIFTLSKVLKMLFAFKILLNRVITGGFRNIHYHKFKKRGSWLHAHETTTRSLRSESPVFPSCTANFRNFRCPLSILGFSAALLASVDQWCSTGAWIIATTSYSFDLTRCFLAVGSIQLSIFCECQKEELIAKGLSQTSSYWFFSLLENPPQKKKDSLTIWLKVLL